mmetsp:Transcript_14906/g.43549  ORF Transcript_14906/g.43549 Transcript_14906/m.43549 type:complete len:274 (-) Transcript_14906:453-1274(-)
MPRLARAARRPGRRRPVGGCLLARVVRRRVALLAGRLDLVALAFPRTLVGARAVGHEAADRVHAHGQAGPRRRHGHVRGPQRVRRRLGRGHRALRLGERLALPVALLASGAQDLDPRRLAARRGAAAPPPVPGGRRTLPAAHQAVLWPRRACLVPLVQSRPGPAPQRRLRRNGEALVALGRAVRGYLAGPRRLGQEPGGHAGGQTRREWWVGRPAQVLEPRDAAVPAQQRAPEQRSEAFHPLPGSHRTAGCAAQRPQWDAPPAALGPCNDAVF